MSEYTPTTNEVREQWGNAVDYYRSPQQRLPGFDRWLSELIRKEREEAWDEGFQGCAEWYEIHHWQHTEVFEDNPYRKGQP